MRNFEIDIDYKRNTLLILVAIFTLIISIGFAFSTYGTEGFPFSFLIFFFFLILCYKWYKQKHGYEKLTISSTKLVHDKYFKSRLKKRKEYNLFEIENLEHRENENSENYASFVSIRIGGIPYSPKSTRMHVKNPTVLHFDYYGEHVKIGEGLEKFDALKFESMITDMKK